MSKKQQRRLFKPFSQGDASITRDFGGTGLGLAISQRLASLLGGKISVKSRLGQGSEFTLALAIRQLEGVDLVDANLKIESIVQYESTASVVLDGHILLVDDRRDVRFLSKHILSRAGAEITEAADGLQALEAVRATMGADRTFDLILLDMQMPNLDGYDAAVQLRKMGYVGPIIALTADAMQGDMTRCIDCGCNDYLSKPIDTVQLLQMVSRMMHIS